jgi:hypothetical protein
MPQPEHRGAHRTSHRLVRHPAQRALEHSPERDLLLAGRVPGLLTAPTGGLWIAERLAWLPVFAIMLSGLWLAFRRVERG